MPFVEYSPSDAGDKARRNVLENHEFGVSMMERANRNASLMQDVEQRKQKFVQDSLISDQQIQQNRLTLSKMHGEQAVNAAKARVEVASSDLRSNTITQNLKALETASVELPKWVERINGANDDVEIVSTAAEFHDRFGHLAADPQFAQQYAAIEGQLTGRARTRATAYQTRVTAASSGLTVGLDSADPETFARVGQSPFFATAMKDPEFAKRYYATKSAVSEQVNKRINDAREQENKIKLKQAEQLGQIEIERAKADSNRPQVPQYLAEKSIKIAQSSQDLDDLETQFKGLGNGTGPLVGFFRGLNPYDTDVQALKAKLFATVPNLARGVFGEVGVLTDADVANYMSTLPNIKSPQDRAAKLVEMLRTSLERQRSAVSSIIEGQGYRTGGVPGLNGPAKGEKAATGVSDGSSLQQALAEKDKRAGGPTR